MLSREYMERKLHEWNPQWNVQTIEGFSFDQLVAVYRRCQAELVTQLIGNLK